MFLKISINDWLRGLILFCAVVFTFQPVWHAGFIWDDDSMLVGNPYIIGPQGLKEIWSTKAADICPLTFTTFWMGNAIWGMRPLPFHLLNVAMQGGCALLLWRVLQNLNVPGAWFGAFLWALHPVQAESVAWISELKNSQSGLFYLLTILFFLRAMNAQDIFMRRFYDAISLICAALALSSKSSTVVLPLVLALIVWWKQEKRPWRHAIRIVPFVVMALIASAVTLWTEQMQEHDAADALVPESWPARVAIAGYAIWFYLLKLIWPYPLCLIYPRWTVDTEWIVSYLPFIAWALVLFLLWWKRETFSKGLFLAAAYFTIALLPVLGAANQTFSRFSFVADHFQYLAAMGPLALAGGGLEMLLSNFSAGKRWVANVFVTGFLFILCLLSWQRSRAFVSSETLWTDTIHKNPKCAMAYDNLGWTFAQSGRIDDAVALYNQALQVDPHSFGAHFNLANSLLLHGRTGQAITQYREALKIRPNDFHTHSDLGAALMQTGDFGQAISEYKQALSLKPDDPGAKQSLSRAQSLAP